MDRVYSNSHASFPLFPPFLLFPPILLFLPFPLFLPPSIYLQTSVSVVFVFWHLQTNNQLAKHCIPNAHVVIEFYISTQLPLCP